MASQGRPTALTAAACALGACVMACAGPTYASGAAKNAATARQKKALAPASASKSVPSSSGRHDGYVQQVADAEATPSYRYAQMDRETCQAELNVRHISWQPVDEARGVFFPLRLTGPLHGVTFHSAIPASQRPTSPYEIMDCRLVVAMDDFAAQLEKHDVVEVVHMSAYRPPDKGWPDGKIASRHPGALALDVGTLVKRDGTSLNVEKDFHGHIGAKTCGDGAGPNPSTPTSLELRGILCDAADAHLFTVALTPDYNYPHRNHFHLEVTAGVTWTLVH